LSRADGLVHDQDLEAIESHLNHGCDRCNAYIAHLQDASLDRDVNPLLLGLVEPRGPASPSIEGHDGQAPGSANPEGAVAAGPSQAVVGSIAWPTPAPVSEVKAALIRHDRYEVLRLLGSGGMGAVYLAAQRTMGGRPVALKLIRRDLTRQASSAERFRREVTAAARLSPHPNIVTAYDAEEAGAVHFLVMEYVDGLDLGRLVDRGGPLPPNLACRYAMEAAEGLQHVHRHGMVHRDIKPQNLMRSRDGHIKILDLGLALFAREVWPTVTKDDSLLGTADYLAPEQARKAHKVDIRADVYSLGCTLYFLLTGQPPYPGVNVTQKLLSHADAAPRPLSAFRADLPHGLQRVLDRMMAKDPAHRYQTPAEAARALAPFAGPVTVVKAPGPAAGASSEWELLADLIDLEPIAVDEPRPVSRRRNRWPPVKVTATLLIAAAIGLAGVVRRVQTDKGELIIETTDPSVEIRVEQGGNLVTIVDPKTKQKIELRAGDYDLKLGGKDSADLHLSTDTFTLKRGDQTIVKVWRSTPKSAAGPTPTVKVGEIRRFKGHTGPVQGVVFSPDGRRALSGSGWPEGDRTMRLWDVATGRELRRFTGHRDGVGSVAFSPDGRRVLSGSMDSSMRLWDVATGRELRRFDGHTDSVSSVAFTPDGRRALSASFDKSLRLWDVETGQELRSFQGHTEWIFGAALSPDGRRALSGSKDWTLRAWDVETGRELRLIGGKTAVHCVAFAPDGERGLSGGEDNMVRLWDLETGQELRLFAGHDNAIKCVAFSPDGRRVLSGGLDRTVRLWDADSGRELRRFEGHRDFILSVAFSVDGRHALSAGGVREAPAGYLPGSDFAIRLWALPAADGAAKADPETAGPGHP
jgi:WD40 repeat protein